jgi:hypothetical protein
MPNESKHALAGWPMSYKRSRFWVRINDGYVRLTLRPGQQLHHYAGGRDEEGWSSEAHIWSHEGDHIRLEWMSDGVDCDGRLSDNTVCVCDLDKLTSRHVLDDAPLVPAWEHIEHEHRDYEAEKAGY